MILGKNLVIPINISISTFFSVDDLPIDHITIDQSSHLNILDAQFALPTPNGLGVYFFHQTNVFELECDFDNCYWQEKEQKMRVIREGAPIAMYITPELSSCPSDESGLYTLAQFLPWISGFSH